MKKAKEPSDFVNKATDLLSLFKNLTGGKKENQQSENAETPVNTVHKEEKKPPQDAYARPVPQPVMPPNDYGTNIFRNVIERHDRKIKNIINKQKKDGGK